MRARVATFEGEGRGPEYDEQIEQICSEVQSGNRPPGLEDAKGVLILSGESGKRIAITLFEEAPHGPSGSFLAWAGVRECPPTK